MTKFPAAFVNLFDLDIILRDAATDPQNRPTRRMIANAAIGMHVEDAYYSTRELREAMSWLHEGDPRGKGRLAAILSNPHGNDFQRCLYYCLAGRGVVEMLDDMLWLEELLEARGRIAGKLSHQRLRARQLVAPYVADEPDGPIVSADESFSQGRSWWSDPRL